MRVAIIILIVTLIIHFTINAVSTILLIDKPLRPPIKPVTAAGVVIGDLAYICALILVLGFSHGQSI